jgi:hypothetical protein
MSKIPTAFVYTEIDNSAESLRPGEPNYIIHYNRHNGGCYEMHSYDEKFFIEEIRDLKRRNNISVLSRLPNGVKKREGPIIRKSYDLSSLLQASAGNNSNK